MDVGCGSGVLSIAALALGAGHAVGLDIDNDAVISSKANLAEAGFTDKSTIFSGSIPHAQVPDGGFDVVGANIAANVLIALAEPLIASVADDGVIITSGVLDVRLDDVIAAFKAAGGEVKVSRQIEDWTATQITRSTGTK